MQISWPGSDSTNMAGTLPSKGPSRTGYGKTSPEARPMGHKVNPSAFYIRWLSAALTGIP